MEALSAERLRGACNLLRWQAERLAARALRRFGWGTIGLAAGMVLLTACLALAWLGSRDAARLAAELERRQGEPAPVLIAPADDSELVTNYYASLPRAEHMPAVIESLLRLAQSHDVGLGAGEYRMQTGVPQRSSGYRIRFPVTGDAAAIQSFVIDALNRHASLALDGLTMRRSHVAAQSVEASVQFVLWTTGEGA